MESMPQNFGAASRQKEWYKNWWGIIIAILFFPFFAVWYIWAKSTWSKKVKVAATTGLVILAVIGFSAKSNQPYQQPNKSTSTQVESNKETASQPTSIPKAKQVSELGKEAFLRLPDNTDSEQRILLAPTKEVYEKLSKTLLANDSQGLLDLITNEGVFAVPMGTKVLLIDKAFAIRKVRILQGEMQGKAGWVAMEWVVNQ